MHNIPRVGLGVLIENQQGQVLLGKRLNAHGDATWAPPGGHLEFGESFEACGIREVEEETGLILKTLDFVAVTNDIFTKEERHYVSIFMRGRLPEGQIIQNREPHKIDTWQWFNWDALPEPLFLPLQTFLTPSCPQHKMPRAASIADAKLRAPAASRP